MALADVAVLSPGTTLGWRVSDETLVQVLEAAGASVQVIRPRYANVRLRRGMLVTDAIESVGSRAAARRVGARSVIFSSITAALLQAPRIPYAVRFDTLARDSRPGWQGAAQRAREPSALAGARVLLPTSEHGAQAAAALLGSPPPVVALPPVALEPVETSPAGDYAIAYGGNPQKRGLDVLCAAWNGGRLLIGGVDTTWAHRFLRRAGITVPPGVEFLGRLERTEWLEHVAGARAFVSAARYEDWGIASMEALNAGVPLIMLPSQGPNEALPLARMLAPKLVARDGSASALSAALQAGLSFSQDERVAYARRAQELLAPYRAAALPELVRREVLPRLLA